MKNDTIHSIIIIIAVVLLSTFVVYLPFLTNTFSYLGLKHETQGMRQVYENYDGVLYIVPAKTWYNPSAVEQLKTGLSLPLEYYPAHLPGYPVFIALISPLLGYLPGMIVVTVLFATIASIALYMLIKNFKLSQHPLLLTIVFLFLPRLLVVRSVGAPETLFIAAIIGSLYFFEKKEYLWAGIIGGIAAVTKTPGIILFAAYCLVFIERMIRHKEFSWQWLYTLFIPAGLLSVFYFYYVQSGDFFAYFHTTGVVPMPYPFSAFNADARWVGTAWLEDLLLYLFLYGYAVISLKDIKYRSLFYFPAVFLILSLFVQHRDLSRYMLPLWPFALIAFERVWTSKKFYFLLLLLFPAIYLYAWNFMLQNRLPIADWSPFL